MTLRVVLTKEQQRQTLRTMRALVPTLPTAAQLREAALRHLRKRGRVREPMTAGRPVPQPWLADLLKGVRQGRPTEESLIHATMSWLG